MFRAQGIAAFHAAYFLRKARIKDVGRADKTGDKRRARTHVKIAWGIHLLDAPVIEHRHPVRHGKGLALIVGDKNKGDAEFLLKLLQLELHLFPQLEIERP